MISLSLSLSLSLALSPFLPLPIAAAPLPTQCTLVDAIALNCTDSTTVILKSCDLTSPVLPFGVTYTWTKNGATLTESRFEVSQYGQLAIKNATRSDLGVYQVTISNKIGNAVHTVKLVEASCTTTAAVTPPPQRLRSQDHFGEFFHHIKWVFLKIMHNLIILCMHRQLL